MLATTSLTSWTPRRSSASSFFSRRPTAIASFSTRRARPAARTFWPFGVASMCVSLLSRWITFPFYETLLLEARHDSGHRRRPHLFGARELAQSERSAENDDGKRREAGSGQSTGVVFLAQLAQEMDRRRMELVREGFGVLTLRHASGTSLISPTTLPCPSESSQTQISRPFMRAMMCGSARLFAPEDLMRACVFFMSLTS